MPKVWFPRRVQLSTFDRTMTFEPGWQEVPSELADHWWFEANGAAFIRPL